MPLAERRADAHWEGNLTQGKGTVTGSTGALGTLPVTWAARTESPNGMTSPEELIAAAQASCYAMAFSNVLNGNGTPPQSLDVTATCTLDRVDGKVTINTMDITVRGKVPGVDQATFEQLAQKAEQGCPVANALRNNLQIHVSAQLEQ